MRLLCIEINLHGAEMRGLPNWRFFILLGFLVILTGLEAKIRSYSF